VRGTDGSSVEGSPNRFCLQRHRRARGFAFLCRFVSSEVAIDNPRFVPRHFPCELDAGGTATLAEVLVLRRPALVRPDVDSRSLSIVDLDPVEQILEVELADVRSLALQMQQTGRRLVDQLQRCISSTLVCISVVCTTARPMRFTIIITADCIALRVRCHQVRLLLQVYNPM